MSGITSEFMSIGTTAISGKTVKISSANTVDTKQAIIILRNREVLSDDFKFIAFNNFRISFSY